MSIFRGEGRVRGERFSLFRVELEKRGERFSELEKRGESLFFFILLLQGNCSSGDYACFNLFIKLVLSPYNILAISSIWIFNSFCFSAEK